MLTGINEIKHLVNTVLTEGELIIFLGAGSSVEGSQGAASFPDFKTIIGKILSDAGVTKPEDEWRSFLDVIKVWENESSLSFRLNDYLYGKPGLAHIQLASTVMSLFPEVNMSFLLTTNYDDLMYKAFLEVAKGVQKRDPKSFTLNNSGFNQASDKTLNAIPRYVRKGSAVILKLFGDLDSQSPIFHSDRMPFDKNTERWLSTFFEKPVLFIGYSLHDAPILRLLINSQSQSPVFIVSPNASVPDNLDQISQRNFYTIKQGFSDFLHMFMEQLALKKSGFEETFSQYIKYADHHTKFADFEKLKTLLEKRSAPSILRYINKNTISILDSERIPIKPVGRPESGPNLLSFLKESKPILSIIGESGAGKSTLLYSFSTTIQDKYISLFYDIHQLQAAGSLAKKLATDIYVDLSTLDDGLAFISQILKVQNKILLILIDGLNESTQIPAINLRYEIEEIAQRLPAHIKIVYSCRKVFWEAGLNSYNDIPRDLYFGNQPYTLGDFSVNEAHLAYNEYQIYYNLKTSWELLSGSVKEHIHDPLMLKFISEAYAGNVFPDFAPAVSVFDKYLKTIRLKYKHTPLLDFLDLMIDYQLTHSRAGESNDDVYTYAEIRTDNSFHLLILQQLANKKFPEDPLNLLEDENIIAPIDTYRLKFKFVYERFYEFLLGTRLSLKLADSHADSLNGQIAAYITIFLNRHYSFYQGLKSAVVSLFLNSENLQIKRSISNLLNDGNERVKQFGKEIIHELAFDSKQDIFHLLNINEINNENDIDLILDIAAGNEQIIPVAVRGLFSLKPALRVKSCRALITSNEANNHYTLIEVELFKFMSATTIGAKELAMGICYFGPVIFVENFTKTGDGFIGMSDFILKLKNLPCWNQLIAHLPDALAEVIREEGAKFFGADFTEYGLNYPWVINNVDFENHKLALLALLRNPSTRTFNSSFEAIKFFSAMRKSESEESADKIFAYQLEYRIVQWMMIRNCQDNYSDTLKILDRLVYEGNHFNIDFALGVMEFSLFHLFRKDKEISTSIVLKLKEWTSYFEQNFPAFYLALTSEQPFSFNFIPLVMLAKAEAQILTRDNEPIAVLNQYLSSGIDDKVEIALLAARWLAKEFPVKVLNTMEPFINSILHINWINFILAEISFNYPRLIEDFMSKCKFTTERRNIIRSPEIPVLVEGIQYNGEKLYLSLMLGDQKNLNMVAVWYERIYASSSLNVFCKELLVNSGHIAV